MKIISLILARGGSKGILRKNLIELENKPLIAHSILHAKHSTLANDVYVSTDDPDIGSVSSEYGAKVIWRPSEISGDHSPAEEAIKHALETIEEVDVVVFLQTTSPLRESEDINFALNEYITHKYDSLFSAVKLGDRFVWRDGKKCMESISYDYRDRKRRQDIEDEYYIENGSIYIFSPKIFKKYNNRLGGKIGKYIMNDNKLLEIDNHDDYKLCKYYMREIKWQND